MSEQREMNIAGTVVAAGTGIILVALSLGAFAAFPGLVEEGTANEFQVGWEQVDHVGSAQAAVTSAPGNAESQPLMVTRSLIASVTVEVDPCEDQRTAGVTPEATVTIIVSDGAREIGRQSGSCTALGAEPFVVDVTPRPTMAAAEGADVAAAEKAAWDSAATQNKTASYKVRIESARPSPGGLPLPGAVPGASLRATATLTVQLWQPVATLEPEVLR